MIKDLHFPEKCIGHMLDEYLARGWYRLGQIIFTTDYIPHGESWCPVFWLRFRLDELHFNKKQLSLLKANRNFTVDIKPLNITVETEELYDLYKQHIDFEVSPTLTNYLYDGSIFGATQNVFQTLMIEIRDNGKLIAMGVFDEGKKTIAGIINIYHPDYYKYSLGKFLMLTKISYAMNTGKEWYYPGYIAHGYPKFDYKLFAGREAAEIYDPSSQLWLPYSPELLAELAGE
jgi:leucyl-tRNA---protein transferase